MDAKCFFCRITIDFGGSLSSLNLYFIHKQEKLPPTDSRLRPDQRCLENGEYEMANAEKLRLEQRQRQVNFHI